MRHLALCVGLALLAGCGERKNHWADILKAKRPVRGEAVKAEPKAKAKEELPGTLYAWQVFQEYRTSRQAARKTYSGKWLTLRGHLWQIRGDQVFLAVSDAATGQFHREAVLCRMVGDIPAGLRQAAKVL